ncbi:MAG: prenyltransferase/squalene oxidase repeat-containing protein, partial [Planctomycetota bacterium]
MRRAALVLALTLPLLLGPVLAGSDDDEKATKKADAALRKSVNEAIGRGVKFLRGAQAGDGSFPSVHAKKYPMGPTALAALALLHSGVPRSDTAIRRAFAHLRRRYAAQKDQVEGMRSGLRTYSVTLTIMALAQYATAPRGTAQEKGPAADADGSGLEKQDLSWMKEMTAWLISKQQYERGAWRYPEGGYDNSNTQYALLALKEARRTGIEVPPRVFQKALAHWLGEQQEDGPRVPRFEEEGGDGIYTARRYRVRGHDRARGWGYYKEAPVTGSMTTAGVASVAICVHELEGKGWKLDAKAKQSVRDGIAWLGESFSVSQNPGGRDAGTGPGSMYHYYYLYGLERAGVLARVVYMGERRWYAEGARYLVDEQDPDGGWRPYDRKRPGPGLRREGRREG